VIGPHALGAADNPLAGISGDLFDIRIEFEPREASSVTLEVRGVAIIYDSTAQRLTCSSCSAPLAPIDGCIRLQVLADRTSLEIFANDGLIYMPVFAIADPGRHDLSLRSSGGEGWVNKIEVYPLRSAWTDRGDGDPL
jgi:fructan beta-fructosidase